MKKALTYWIPVAIYLGFLALYAVFSALSGNDYLYQPVWDIGHYLTISEIGYEVSPCTDAAGNRTGGICGNVGWYPAWPLIVATVRPLLGGSSQLAFAGLAHLFCLLFFIALFELISKLKDREAATITVLAVAMSPASFYLLTGFPYSLMLLLLSIYILLLYRPHRLLRDIGLFSSALTISLCYPTGLLFALIPFIWFIRTERKNKSGLRKISNWLSLFKYLLPFILGPLLLWAYFYFKFDDFFLQLHFQEKFGRTWAFPLLVIYKALVNFSLLRPENATILWYGFIFLLFGPYKIRAELWITAIFLFLFSPATGTVMSIYRHYLIILPAYIIIGASTRPFWIKIGFLTIGLILSLKILFPLFMAYRLV
jgi:hypothetical protein